MFYPPCPKCGGKVESAEPDSFDRANSTVSRRASLDAALGHPHPHIKMLTLGITVFRQIYKRFPGGGAKRCTAATCGHQFN